jgi:hypothetical protein
MAYHGKRNFDLAMKDINQAIKLNPNYGNAFYERGIVNYDKLAFDRTIAVVEEKHDKPAYVMNFGADSSSYGNRREGDRIIQEPGQAIKNNRYNAFAYVAEAEPQQPKAPPPLPVAAVEKPAAVAAAPVARPEPPVTAASSVMPVSQPAEAVPLPQERPRQLQDDRPRMIRRQADTGRPARAN